MKTNRENLSYKELYDDDSQNITYWTFIGFILVWVFTIIVRIY
jgi:hypothetical protein